MVQVVFCVALFFGVESDPSHFPTLAAAVLCDVTFHSSIARVLVNLSCTSHGVSRGVLRNPRIDTAPVFRGLTLLLVTFSLGEECVIRLPFPDSCSSLLS